MATGSETRRGNNRDFSRFNTESKTGDIIVLVNLCLSLHASAILHANILLKTLHWVSLQLGLTCEFLLNYYSNSNGRSLEVAVALFSLCVSQSVRSTVLSV